MDRMARWTLWTLVAAAFACSAGCTKEITIIRYPPFWTPQLKSIAVVPFRSADKQVGEQLADELANSIRATGTYRVFNRSEIEEMAKLQDLQIAFGDDQVVLAAQLRKITALNVQAIVQGRVTNCTATTHDEERQEPIMIWDARSKQMVPSGAYRTYTFTRNEGNVGATAALIDLNGKTIHATGQPATCMQWAQGSPPEMDPFACRSAAMTSVVQQLVEEFAVVRKKIDIDLDKTLKLATCCYDGKWDDRKSFKVGEPKMVVVLNLPPVCDRNNFRITIIRKGERKDLAVVDVLWSSKFPAVGKEFEFVPADISAKGGGPGTYTAKFYSGMEAQPIHTLDFNIES
jgi:hypothetical protein